MAWHEEVPEDWKGVDITPAIERGKKESPGNYRAVSQFMKILLESIAKHMNNRKVTGSSQHGFMKGKSCFTKLLVFYCKVTILVDEGIIES